jgi:glucan phosphoethanolaminetransferase (alkaline phosphatase superfamily)
VVTLPNFIISYLIGIPLLVDVFDRRRLYAILLVGAAPTLLSLLYWKLVGMKETFTVSRKHRILPFCFSFAGALSVLFLNELWQDNLSVSAYTGLRFLMGMYLVISFAGFIVTFFWKISLHMLGLSPFLGGLVKAIFSTDTLSDPGTMLFIVLVLLCCLASMLVVAWARYRLKSHDKWQLLAGILLGAALGFAAFSPLMDWADPTLPKG